MNVDVPFVTLNFEPCFCLSIFRRELIKPINKVSEGEISISIIYIKFNYNIFAMR